MNLILCNKSCEYQDDGYCKINSVASLSCKKVDGCSYYSKKKSRESDSTHKQRLEYTNPHYINKH